MFGKKKSDETAAGATPPAGQPQQQAAEADDKDLGAAPPLKPFSRKGSHATAKPPAATSFQPEIPRRIPDIPGPSSRRLDRPMGDQGDSRRLVVGRDICLKGEITACDKLVVEGVVEVALSGARAIEVAPTGHFTGNADVAEADISGRFEGELIARERLIVRAGGHVRGTVRYGRIVIESGGEVTGDMQTLESAKP
jgi:cytoskeletal protein CcmA (bactofilin family)